LAVNPIGKVPAIDDGGFVLNESRAIHGYLVDTYCKDNTRHWYPTDIKTRAQVNSQMYWSLELFESIRSIFRAKYRFWETPTQADFDVLHQNLSLADDMYEKKLGTSIQSYRPDIADLNTYFVLAMCFELLKIDSPENYKNLQNLCSVFKQDQTLLDEVNHDTEKWFNRIASGEFKQSAAPKKVVQ